MSDMKPGSLRWYGPDGLTDPEPSDLISVIRQAIESGEIEGRIIDNRVTAWPGEEGVGDGLFLVIPLSDGGEDRP